MSDYDITTDENGCIRNGLRADIMRCCMENKNLLTEEGSMYVGTGEKIVIGEGTSNRITIAKTRALNPGNYGEILMVKDGDLCYSKLSEINFQYGTSGVVEGDLGDHFTPVEEACFSLKRDLYTANSTVRFSSNTCSITIPSDTKIIYISIFTQSFGGGANVDFGFINLDYALREFSLYPANYYDYLRTANAPYTTNDANYFYLRVTRSQSGSSLTLTFAAMGPGASIVFHSSSYNLLHYKIF